MLITKSSIKIIVAIMCISSAIIGCNSIEHRHGLHPGIEVFDGLVPNVSKREDVLAKLGTPNFTSMYGEDTWFYAYLCSYQRPFRAPKPIDQHTYKLTFNAEGVLTSMQDVSLENAPRHVIIVRDETQTKGDDIGFAKEAFGSLGKYNERDPLLGSN